VLDPERYVGSTVGIHVGAVVGTGVGDIEGEYTE